MPSKPPLERIATTSPDSSWGAMALMIESASGQSSAFVPSELSARTTSSGCRRSASGRSEEHTSELQSLRHLVCRLLLEQKHAPLRLSLPARATEHDPLAARPRLAT